MTLQSKYSKPMAVRDHCWVVDDVLSIWAKAYYLPGKFEYLFLPKWSAKRALQSPIDEKYFWKTHIFCDWPLMKVCIKDMCSVNFVCGSLLNNHLYLCNSHGKVLEVGAWIVFSNKKECIMKEKTFLGHAVLVYDFASRVCRPPSRIYFQVRNIFLRSVKSFTS